MVDFAPIERVGAARRSAAPAKANPRRSGETFRTLAEYCDPIRNRAAANPSLVRVRRPLSRRAGRLAGFPYGCRSRLSLRLGADAPAFDICLSHMYGAHRAAISPENGYRQARSLQSKGTCPLESCKSYNSGKPSLRTLPTGLNSSASPRPLLSSTCRAWRQCSPYRPGGTVKQSAACACRRWRRSLISRSGPHARWGGVGRYPRFTLGGMFASQSPAFVS